MQILSIAVTVTTFCGMLGVSRAFSGENPPCELCGCSCCTPGDFPVGNIAGVIPVTEEFINCFGGETIQEGGDTLGNVIDELGFTEIPCSILDLAATGGAFPPEVCVDQLRLNPILRESCGCPEPPSQCPLATACGTSSPTPAPTDSTSISSMCFSGSDVVTQKGVGEVSMDQVRVGDYVQTVGGKFTRVFSLAHYHIDWPATFIQIHSTPYDAIDDDKSVTTPTKKMAPPLEITGDHLLWANGAVIRASRVRVGDVLDSHHGTDDSPPLIVTQLTTVQRRGVFAPLTESGDLLVNGIRVSSYVGLWDDTYGVVWNQHKMGHLLFSPLRIVCRWNAQYCASETHDESGYSFLYNWLIELLQWMRLRGGNAVTFFVSALAFPLLVAFWTAEQLLLHPTEAVILGGTILVMLLVCGPKKKC